MFYRKLTSVAVGALLCVACSSGGGGGAPADGDGSSGSTSGGSSTPPSGSTDQIGSVATGSCLMELDSAVSAQEGADVVVLQDLGQGCDYSVSGTLQIRATVSIGPGVTIVLQDNANLSFLGENVQLLGTPSGPIRFQADNDLGGWGTVQFIGEGAHIESVLFSGGGRGNADGAMVELRGDNALLVDSTFAGSDHSGLEITDTDARAIPMFEFSRNTFTDNDAYPLILTGEYLADLDAESDYTGVAEPNGERAVLVSARSLGRSRVNNIGIPVRLSEDAVRFSVIGGTVIGPGVILEFPEFSEIDMRDFSAEGSPESPIVFRGWPDAVSGWDGVQINGEVTLSHVTIEDGGAASGGLGSALFVDFTFPGTLDEINLSDVSIVGSQGFGLDCNEASSTFGARTKLVNVTFEDIALADVASGCDIEIASNEELAPVPERHDVSACNAVLRDLVEIPSTLTNSESDCDYYVVGSVDTENLAVQAGTSIYFARNADLTVGTLSVFGNEASPVTFLGEIMQPGSWDGLNLSGDSVLQYMDVVNGGDERSAAVSVDRASTLTVVDTSITGSAGIGMEVSSTFSVTFDLGTIVDEFSRNSFTGNGLAGLSMPVELVPMLDEQSVYDSLSVPNGETGIRLSEVHSSGSITLSPAFGVPWRFANYRASSADDSSLVVQAGAEIIVEPGGVMLLGSSTSMMGTVDSPVLISGAGDDPTEWGGISLSVGSEVSAQYVEITGGGASDNGINSVGGSGAPFFVLSTAAVLNLDNVTIQDSRSWAIDCVRTRPENIVLSNMTYARNALGDVNPECSE